MKDEWDTPTMDYARKLAEKHGGGRGPRHALPSPRHSCCGTPCKAKSTSNPHATFKELRASCVTHLGGSEEAYRQWLALIPPAVVNPARAVECALEPLTPPL